MRNFNKYITWEFKDFIESDRFRSWVLTPTNDDLVFWDEFLETNPEKLEVIDQARDFLLATRNYFGADEFGKEDLQIGLGKVLGKASGSQPASKRRFLIPVSYRWGMAAASVVVGLVGWYLFFASTGPTTYSTDFGEWQSIVLPDGSKVDLNANSELILSDDWAEGTTRQVWLKGEAFFEVTDQRSSNTKFQVITNDLTIEVLGTEFNVQERGEQTEVYLQKGKIKLDLGIAEKDLNPGDFISYSAEKNKVIAQIELGTNDHSSWKEGVLKLTDATILEILREIEEIYGVEIMVSNKAMLSEKRTIGVPMKNLEIVIPILETTLGADISKVGNKLFVK